MDVSIAHQLGVLAIQQTSLPSPVLAEALSIPPPFAPNQKWKTAMDFDIAQVDALSVVLSKPFGHFFQAAIDFNKSQSSSGSVMDVTNSPQWKRFAQSDNALPSDRDHNGNVEVATANVHAEVEGATVHFHIVVLEGWPQDRREAWRNMTSPHGWHAAKEFN